VARSEAHGSKHIMSYHWWSVVDGYLSCQSRRWPSLQLIFCLFPKLRDAENTSVLHKARYAVRFDAESLEPQMSKATEPLTVMVRRAASSPFLIQTKGIMRSHCEGAGAMVGVTLSKKGTACGSTASMHVAFDIRSYSNHLANQVGGLIAQRDAAIER